MRRPAKKTFKVYNIFEVRDFLIAKNAFTEDEFHDFWLWWCDGDGRTGPCDRALRNVPIGYWGWTQKKPYRQLTAEEHRARDGEVHDPDRDESIEDEKTIHKVLVALATVIDSDDNLVYMAW